ncbi:RagB/SusD family nutrient uptake outer membrane protein [Belliella aquatica]|nr:RagB/SusD family nutrient uptake outer membrane protein [Belliella aquatica]MCH7406834.1 RagB/SusD family nutrient uptake outer membrane protein [Belliella aquatica]
MKKYTYIFIIIGMLLTSCEDFLSEKPSLGLVVPTNLDDFEALLSNDQQIFNQTPAIGEVASADFNIPFQHWQSLRLEWERQAYIWAEDVNQNGELPDWSVPFQQIFYANVVLDGLGTIEITQDQNDRAKQLEGIALFFRAFAYHQLLELFTPYTRFDGEDSEFGLPIRMNSLVTPNPNRASVAEVKSLIKADLEKAIELLPLNEPLKTRPSISAAKALLMRVYFMEGDYSSALELGQQLHNEGLTLIDYTQLPVTTSNPFGIFNQEVIFHSQLMLYQFYNSPLTFIDQNLLALYNDNDARKALFFINRGGNGLNFKAFHTGRATWFGGIGTNEVLLTYIECLVRAEDLTLASELLNSFLEFRIKDFEEITFSSQEEALEVILLERRKELSFRGLRWMDLKRLNFEGYQINLQRDFGESIYSLTPNSLAYVFPIPPQEIDRSSMIQNPR